MKISYKKPKKEQTEHFLGKGSMKMRNLKFSSYSGAGIVY